MKEKMIEAKIGLMEEASQLDFNRITLQPLPEATLYLSRNIQNISDEEFVEVISDFINELQISQLDSGYPIGSITKREQVLKGEFSNYSYLYIEQPNPKEGHPYFRAVKGISSSAIMLGAKIQSAIHISVFSQRWKGCI